MSDLSRLAPLLLLLALPAAADQLETEELPPEHGPYAGVRLSYAFPLGRFHNGEDEPYLGSTYDSAIPLQLELGWRFNPHVRAGVYGTYALVQPNSFCPDALDCRASSVRVGVSAEYHVMPLHRTDAWVGVGAGYEQSTFGLTQKGVEAESTYSGLEFFALQAGADYRVARHLTLGPAFTWTFARYSTLDVRLGSGTGSETVQKRALHGWMMFGVRAQAAF